MGWRSLFEVLFAAWMIGWLFYGTRHWVDELRERRRSGEPVFRHLFPTIAVAYAMHLIVWPGGLFADLEEYLPRAAIALRLRPSWSVLRTDEHFSKIWTLKNGKELSVSAFGHSPDDPASISADGDVDVIEFRLKRIAPIEEEPTKWRRMPRMSRRELAEFAEDEVELEETPPFEAKARLEQGRYVVEFRIENEHGEHEECSGIPLVVY
jgi:hypothetical protein